MAQVIIRRETNTYPEALIVLVCTAPGLIQSSSAVTLGSPDETSYFYYFLTLQLRSATFPGREIVLGWLNQNISDAINRARNEIDSLYAVHVPNWRVYPNPYTIYVREYPSMRDSEAPVEAELRTWGHPPLGLEIPQPQAEATLATQAETRPSGRGLLDGLRDSAASIEEYTRAAGEVLTYSYEGNEPNNLTVGRDALAVGPVGDPIRLDPGAFYGIVQQGKLSSYSYKYEFNNFHIGFKGQNSEDIDTVKLVRPGKLTTEEWRKFAAEICYLLNKD